MLSNNNQSKREPSQCTFCMRKGHIYTECRSLKAKILNENNSTFNPVYSRNSNRFNARNLRFMLDPSTLTHSSEEELKHVKELITEFAHIFALPREKLKTTHLVKHHIKLTLDIPVKSKRFRQTPEMQKAFQNEIDSLLKQGILRESTSVYSLPTWVIRKRHKPAEQPRY